MSRLTGSKPVRRRARKVRFRSRRGVRSHGGSIFRAHKGYRKGGVVFRAHASRALRAHPARAVRLKTAKAAAYKPVGIKRNPYPKLTARKYKAAGHRTSWGKHRKHAAKYRAVRYRRG